MMGRNINILGRKIHYHIGGRGPAVLMLHGFTLTGEEWMPFAIELMDRYTVIVADLPGHGGSSPLPGDFRFAEAAGIMHNVLDRLGVEEVSGVGHSAGTMTLLHMAEQRPDRFEALMLVAGANHLPAVARRGAREDRWERLDAETQAFYRRLHPGGEAQARAIFEQFNAFEHNLECVGPETLAKLPARTMIVFGDRDPYFPVSASLEMYRALPEAELWVIPAQGHTPIWPEMGGDAGEAVRFLEKTRAFLGQRRVSRAA